MNKENEMVGEEVDELTLENNINIAKDKVLGIFTKAFGDGRDRDEMLAMCGELISKRILLKIIESLKGIQRANFVTYVNLGKIEEATNIAVESGIDIEAITESVSKEVLDMVTDGEDILDENDELINQEMSEEEAARVEKIIKKVMAATGLVPDDEETVEEFLKRAVVRKEELDKEEKDLEAKQKEKIEAGEDLNEEEKEKLEEIKRLKEELASLE